MNGAGGEPSTANPTANPTASIVVIEDERDLADAIASRLRAEGYAVDSAHDGPSGLALVTARQADLVILDVMLPGLDGFEVCRRIREHGPVPVIMLTARSSEADLVSGLGVGADDYVTKPFSQRELTARVHALLRRSRATGATGATGANGTDGGSGATGTNGDGPDRRRVGDVELDPVGRRARRGGVTVHLTVTEFDLALHLARHPDRVFTREQLLQQVWGYPDGTGARTVDSHVQAVRRKLGHGFVRTVHGVGYGLGAGGEPGPLP